MASTINASNSGAGGLISAGDASGVLALQTAGTTAVTLDTSGNVGIGTSSPSKRLSLRTSSADIGMSLGTGANAFNQDIDFFNSADVMSGRIRYYPDAGFMSFWTASSERARIDSSGSLLVGTTSAGGNKMVVSGATGGTAVLNATNSTGSGNQFGIVSNLGSTANNTSSAHFQGGTAGAGNWYLLGNGTTTYTSDQRLKKNIETTRDGYLADICRLRVVKYNWRNDAEGTDKELGLIAQEVEQVFPRLVQDDLNKISPDDDTLYKTLKGSVIPYMLLKAIQELKAINDTQAETINALTARIVAIESRGTV